jgi:diguanylate cyclase (GGDEF)-like protein
VAAVLTGILAERTGSPEGSTLPWLLTVTLFAAGALLAIDLPVGRAHIKLHGGDVVFGVALLLTVPEQAVVGAGFGAVVYTIVHRQGDLRRAAVGVGATSLGAAVGAVVFHAIQFGEVVSVRSAIAVLAGTIAAALTSTSTVAVVRGFGQGLSQREFGSAVLSSFGVGTIAGAAATQTVFLGQINPMLAVIGLLPLLLVSVASLSFGRQRREAEQSRLLKAVTRQLQGGRLEQAVARSAHAFRSGLDLDAVIVVIFGGYRTVWCDATRTSPPDLGFSQMPGRLSDAARTIVGSLSGVTSLPGEAADQSEALGLLGLSAALGAPLLRQGHVSGLLVVGDHDPDRIADCDTELVGMFADQLGMTLERGWLTRTLDQMQSIEAELQYQANHDSLTGLANRHHFNRQLGRILDEQSDGLHALLLIDLDDFKPVNDLLGHPAGDELLQIVGRRIRYYAHHADVVARLGGDEFGLLLTNLTHAGAATKRADELLGALCQPTLVAGRELVPAASVGIAFNDPVKPDPDILVRRADMALYHAKRLGKGRWATFYEELEVRLAHQLELTIEIERAFERDEFDLWYQPIVALSDGSIAGFEALVRWLHPTRGILRPHEFLTSVTDSGHSERLTKWVLRQAARDASRLTSQSTAPVFVSVNVTAAALLQPGFATALAQCLNDAGTPASSFVVEISETDLVDRPARAGDVLDQLASIGVSLSLDDFGVGPSSIATVKSLRLAYAKVDMVFLDRMEDGRSGSLAEPVLQLAAGLAERVVAEGVETAEQAALVKSVGCDLAQGFFFGEPMNIASALDVVHQHEVPSAGTTNPTR